MKNIDVLKLEVETDPPAGTLSNLIVNPSGEKGAWGWVTPVAGTTIVSTTVPHNPCLQYNPAASVANFFYTEPYPVTVGNAVGASWVVQSCNVGAGNGWYRASVEFLNASFVLLSATTPTAYLQEDNNQGRAYLATATVPASTVYARLRFDMYSSNAGAVVGTTNAFMTVHNAAMVTAATAGALSVLTRTNLMKNPSFGVDLAGWEVISSSAGSPTLARSTALADSGSASLAVTLSATHTDQGARNIRGTGGVNDITFTPNTTYAFSARVRAANGGLGTATLRVSWYQEVGLGGVTLIREDNLASSGTSGTWSLLSGTAMSPSNSGNVWVQVGVVFNVPLGGSSLVQHIDSVLVEKVGAVGTYFDGDTPDVGTNAVYAWSGTAHNSTSTLTEYAPYSDGVWTNILGPTHEIKLARESLNVGLLTATILDETLDPAIDATLRPGKGVRLRVLEHGMVDGAVTTNLMRNPSAEVDLTGWSAYAGTPTRVTTEHDDRTAAIQLQINGSDNAFVDNRTQNIPVTAGTVYSVSARFKSAVTPRNCNIVLFWKSSNTADLAAISTSAGATVLSSTSAWVTAKLENVVAPAGAAFMMVGCQVNSLTANEIHYIDSVIAVEGTTVPDYFDGYTPDTDTFYTRWTGTGDASTSTKTALVVGALRYTSLFEGTVTHVETGYDLQRTDEKQARITLVAADNIRTLANVSRTEGVETMGELRYLLEGAGVPWTINGNSNQLASAVVVAKNESASLLDQIAITRDVSLGGYAWVNRENVLIAQDVIHLNWTPVAVLDESVYSDMDVSFSTDECINDVRIKWLRYSPATGSTEEITYGPYVDLASIGEWGYHSDEFTFQGAVESQANIDSYAAFILQSNGTPEMRVNSVQIPILGEADLSATKVLLDLYDVVECIYTPKGLDHQSRISGIEHTITPDRWLMNLTFNSLDSVATPQLTPSPGTGSGTTTGTVAVGQGGTGLTSVATGNFLSGNGTSALNVRTPAQVRTDIGADNIANLTTGTLQPIRGGTGINTLAAGSFLTGNGTSAMVARTAVQARTDIGADNASNLTTGTVADARLPTTMANKTLSGTTTIGGQPFAAMDIGNTSAATINASGQVNVSHSLGVVPACILLGSQSFYVRVQGSTSTQFTIEARVAGTGALPASGTTVVFYWMAVA